MGKIEVSKTIINGQRSLIGFVVKGREKDLGGFSEAVVEKSTPISELNRIGFTNNQIAVVGGKVVERGKFRINSLPMLVLNNDTFIPIDNTVDIIKRYVQDNENIGFRMRFSDGSEENLKYENVLNICKWFKPGNFCIRTSGRGKSYIAGKNGMSLDSIPEVIIGKKPEVAPKRMKSAAKEKKSAISGSLEMGFDILDIYGFIKECNGSIIKLPSEDYVAATDGGAKDVEGFTPLGIGEVATPNPAFNATKLNVNADFKKVGVVPVSINGMQTNLTSFVYRKKSIFLNGENYIKKFGIAVAKDREEELVSKLGRSLALERIEDKSIIQPLSQVIDAESLAFYKVDTTKLDLISETKRSSSIMTAPQLATVCKKMYELKLLSKALGLRGGIMKDIKDVIGEAGVAQAKSKKLFGIYSMMSQEALDIVTEAGIDIYTGAFVKEGTPAKSSSKGGTGSGAESVEIEYILKGYDAGKITGKQILSWAQDKDTTKLPPNVIKYLTELFKITDMKERYLAASKLNSKVDAEIAEVTKKIWMHNASMYLMGNKTNIHTHDKSKWVVDGSSRVKTAQVYMSTDKEAEGLTVKFKGVNI